MKNKITNMTATLGIVFSLASCIDFRPSGPLPPEPPAEEEAPAIIVPDEDLVVYPASTGVSSEMEFRIEGLGEKGSVSITPDAGIEASLFFDRVDGRGFVTLFGKEGLSVESSFTIEASNGDRHSRKRVPVQEAYLMAGLTTWKEPSSGGSRKILVYTNTGGFSATSASPWLRVDTIIEGEGLVFSVGENTGDTPREGYLDLLDGKGVLREKVTVTQAASDHSGEIGSERAALAEIFMALHGDEWCDSDGWCTDAPLKSWYGVMTNTFKGEEHVVYLHLQYLGARGEIPSAIGNLRHLRELWITGNPGITGTIPSSIGNLTDLKDLSISGTSIGGPIPEAIHGLRKLEILGLDDNLLEGDLPDWLSDMPALYNFGFSLNCFDGQIDPALTETTWWKTPDSMTGTPMGMENLLKGQKKGHRLWL
jgi:hypothetical protein